MAVGATVMVPEPAVETTLTLGWTASVARVPPVTEVCLVVKVAVPVVAGAVGGVPCGPVGDCDRGPACGQGEAGDRDCPPCHPDRPEGRLHLPAAARVVGAVQPGGTVTVSLPAVIEPPVSVYLNTKACAVDLTTALGVTVMVPEPVRGDDLDLGLDGDVR